MIDTDNLDKILVEIDDLVTQAEVLANKKSSGGSGSTGSNGGESGARPGTGNSSKKTTDNNGSNLPAINNITTAGFGKLGLAALAAAAVGFGIYAIKKSQ